MEVEMVVTFDGKEACRTKVVATEGDSDAWLQLWAKSAYEAIAKVVLEVINKRTIEAQENST